MEKGRWHYALWPLEMSGPAHHRSPATLPAPMACRHGRARPRPAGCPLDACLLGVDEEDKGNSANPLGPIPHSTHLARSLPLCFNSTGRNRRSRLVVCLLRRRSELREVVLVHRRARPRPPVATVRAWELLNSGIGRFPFSGAAVIHRPAPSSLCATGLEGPTCVRAVSPEPPPPLLKLKLELLIALAAALLQPELCRRRVGRCSC